MQSIIHCWALLRIEFLLEENLVANVKTNEPTQTWEFFWSWSLGHLWLKCVLFILLDVQYFLWISKGFQSQSPTLDASQIFMIHTHCAFNWCTKTFYFHNAKCRTMRTHFYCTVKIDVYVEILSNFTLIKVSFYPRFSLQCWNTEGHACSFAQHNTKVVLLCP